MGGGGGSLSPTGCAVQTKLPTGLFVLSVPVWRGCGQREHHPGHLIDRPGRHRSRGVPGLGPVGARGYQLRGRVVEALAGTHGTPDSQAS